MQTDAWWVMAYRKGREVAQQKERAKVKALVEAIEQAECLAVLIGEDVQMPREEWRRLVKCARGEFARFRALAKAVQS